MTDDETIKDLRIKNANLRTENKALAEARDAAHRDARDANAAVKAANLNTARALEALAQYTDANTPAMVRDVLILCDALRTRGWGDSYVIDMARAMFARKDVTE